MWGDWGPLKINLGIFRGESGYLFVFPSQDSKFADILPWRITKKKKSESTGSGSNDIYVSNWKFFEECSFLEEVISSNRPTCTNVAAKTEVPDAEDDHLIHIGEEVETKVRAL